MSDTTAPTTRRRRTLSGKVITEDVAATDDLRTAVDGLVQRIRDAKEARDAETAEPTPGAPVVLVTPDGWGDRRQRRANERARKRDNARRARAALGR